VPAARRQARKQATLRRLLIEVEGLRVVLSGERLDLRRVERVLATAESLPYQPVDEASL
jgi:hypothetical protein